MQNAPHLDLAGRPIIAGSPFESLISVLDDAGDPVGGYEGTEPLSAVFVPGDGLPAAWTATVAWQLPFDPAAPKIVLWWEVGITSEVDPGKYDCYLTVDGVTNVVGSIDLIGGIGTSTGLNPSLITLAEAREITGGSIDLIERDAGDVLRALRSASDELRTNLSKRWAAGMRGSLRSKPANIATARTAILASTTLHESDAVRRYVAYRAMFQLMFVLGTSESSSMYANLREAANSEAMKALGRIAVDVEGLGLIVMNQGNANIVR